VQRKNAKKNENDDRDLVHSNKRNKGARARIFKKFIIERFGIENLQKVFYMFLF
jgi:hypothetical protein